MTLAASRKLPYSTKLLLVTLLACSAQAVLNKDFKRREGYDTYGPPPRPAPQYGPPPRQPHREYGVPQQIPFREYGPPALKHGPPKFISGGGGGGGFSSNNFGGGLLEQVKQHFGVPKPFYGPPHIQHKPSGSYGPPPQPQAQYGPPPQAQYGPPPKPQAQYGPPPPQAQYGPPPQAQYGPPPPQHRPSPQYGPPPRPAPQYGPPPQPLPSPHPAPIFKPPHQPATSYGPPPSGPISLPPRPVYGPPPPNYGPPPLPQNIPGPHRPPPFNRVPETTVILTSGGHSGGGHGGHFGGGGGFGGPVKQVQIQIDSAGHTHSISGSQAPFHTACDGWKPIPAPVGAYVENNHIDTQSGYSQVNQGFGTQYNANGGGGGSTSTIITGSSGSGGSIVDGLTDEQLVAIALQSEGYQGSGPGPLPAPEPEPNLPPTGPAEDLGLNSIETDAIQAALGSDDSYNRPPPDSFAPGSVHAQKYNTIGGGSSSFGLPPPPPQGNYLPPPPQAAAFVQQQQHHHHNHAAQAGLAIQYGSQSGNTLPFPPSHGPPPSRPVAFRPPVPQGLLESIGQTVQHLDQFGVKPQAQPEQAYIPPATNEIAATGPGNLGPEYGAPPQIIEQQLPQPQPAPGFIGGGSHHGGNVGNQYGPPQQQYLPPPPPPQRPLPPPPQPQAQYLPPHPNGATSFQQQSFENHFSASQHNQQFVHAQGLPLIQEPRFNQVVHDCGQGPNLVGAGYQLQQQQSQQQQQFTSATAGNAYNAITQSIPISETHQQFIAGAQDSYGPPASGNDIDHEGYAASQKNSVSTLPDGSDPNNLPGLDGLNVISAQKSQSIHISQGDLEVEKQRAAAANQPKYQLQIGPSGTQAPRDQDAANHEEILSQGLLQTILTAIEQPQGSKEQAAATGTSTGEHASNHRYDARRAQSRADHDLDEDATQPDINENEANANNDEQTVAESGKVETKVAAADDDVEEAAIVKEIKPIVAADIDDDAQDDADAKH